VPQAGEGLAAPRFRFYPAARSTMRAIAGALRVARGAPVHSLLAAPYDWSSAIERARRDAGHFDATIVLLSRLDPWVRDLLPENLRVLDAIDSLRRSMAERAKRAGALTRWFWRAESRRVARAEEAAARAYDRVIVVSDEDCAELNAVAIGNGVAIAPLDVAPRAFDFGFWGRLAYFANDDAVSWLVHEIWPAIRSQCANATLLIAGADAPAHVRAAHGREGISVQSPVDDIAAMARQIKVALFPVRYGTGQSNKVLEAAEAGCAIVATTLAMRGLDALIEHADVANDASQLAQSAIHAISNDARRETNARALRAVVEKHYSRDETLRRLREAAA
jgi:glycosyltransferase involved in cell wall biosynthesis